MLEIPGEYGSGSGTIVRLATAFSSLTGKAIKITDIRARRPNPGLRHQHLEAVRTIGKLCSAKILGDQVGSKEIIFEPGKLKGGSFEVNIETAGSIGLLAYAVLIPALFTKEKTVIHIKGGSTASLWSPSVYYMENVLLPTLQKMGIEAKIEVLKHGFYPVGGGEVKFEIHPTKKISPLILTEQGEIDSIEVLSIASSFLKNRNVAERQIIGFQRIIKREKNLNAKNLYVESQCPGSVLVAWAKTSKEYILSGDCVGEEKKPAEVVGEEAGFKLKEEIRYGCTVGYYLSDQLIPFLALAQGKSEIIVPEITDHIKTNIWLCENFFKSKFEIKEFGENFKIICYGKS
ncbi:MAG: RNA 3'-terminal phosphate cyclase [Candidatus Nanoarchaeia archaeon]